MQNPNEPDQKQQLLDIKPNDSTDKSNANQPQKLPRIRNTSGLNPPWQKGKTGNPDPKRFNPGTYNFRSLLRKYLDKPYKEKNKLKKKAAAAFGPKPSNQEVLIVMVVEQAFKETEDVRRAPVWSTFILEQLHGKVPQRTTLEIPNHGIGFEGQGSIEAIAIKFSDQLKPVAQKTTEPVTTELVTTTKEDGEEE